MRLFMAALVTVFVASGSLAFDPETAVRDYRSWKRVNPEPITSATVDLSKVVLEAGGG